MGPGASPHNLWRVVVRELGLLRRNPYIILIIVGGPLIYPFLYSTAYLHKMERDVPICVVDQDRTENSRKLINELDATELLAVTEVVGDLTMARDRLERMSAMAVVVIPDGFDATIRQGKQARILAAISNVRFLVASDISRALGDVLAQRGRVVSTEEFMKLGYGAGQASQLSQPIRPVISNTYNTTENYGDFIIIGLLVIILQQTLLLGLAVSTSLEREQGLLPALFKTSAGSIFNSIIGKGLPYFVLYCAHALLFFSLYFRIFSVPFTGNAAAFGLATALFIAAIIVWTMTVSSFFKEKTTAVAAFLFTSYPFFLVSGYSWPLQALPRILQIISSMLPISHYLRTCAVLTQMHGGWQDALAPIVTLSIILAIGFCTLWLRLFWLKRHTIDSTHIMQGTSHRITGLR